MSEVEPTRPEHVIVCAALAYARCQCGWEFKNIYLKCGGTWKDDETLMLETMGAWEKHKKRKDSKK